jgi:transcriptional regulator with XRE-family HTH domain
MINHYFIQQLRKKHDISQKKLAEELEISRPSYIQIEKGEKELTVSQAQKLADIYDLTMDELIAGEETKRKIKVVARKIKPEKKDIEIRVQEKNIKKFKEVLLYVLEKVGAKPNVGESVINKLLYFIDFDYYEKFEENLTGATYIKNHFGPTPLEFEEIVSEMQKKGEVEKIKSKYFQFDQMKYLPRRPPDLKALNAQEINHINNVLERLSDKCAREIKEYSHGDVPWKSAESGKKIEYESVFYRDDKYSVKEHEDEL